MEYRSLGRTGVSVSELCLGAMMFGGWGNTDHDESIGIIHRALDAGINFIDTADVYSNGESEIIVGKALTGGRRDEVVLATKFHGRWAMTRTSAATPAAGSSREVESLRRLGTDWIDLYQMHRPDPHTDIDETLGALTDLVHQGKVRYIGSSTFPAEEIVEAQWTAERRGPSGSCASSRRIRSSPARSSTTSCPTCERYGMGVIPWSPLNGGWLSGRYRKDDGVTRAPRAPSGSPTRFDLSLPANQRKLDVVEQLAKLAEDAGITLIELALAFVLRHPAVTAAIIGPRTMEQLEDQLGAADVKLADELLDRIDEIVPPGVNDQPRRQRMDSPGDPAARRATPLARKPDIPTRFIHGQIRGPNRRGG